MNKPRGEYPRPDFQRGTTEGEDWINLNGPWLFRFDPEDAGRANNWAAAPDSHFDREIVVPFPWESPLAWGRSIRHAPNDTYFVPDCYLDPDAVTAENYREAPRQTIGWYRRAVRVPEAWAGKRVFLNIGGADFRTTVFVNGQQAGEHEGGYEPIAIDITELAPPGSEAVLTIRVEDPQDISAQPAGKQIRWYQRTSGIWQTVYLEPRGETWFRYVHVEPRVEAEQAEVRFALGGAAPPDDAQAVFSLTGPRGEQLKQVRCPLAEGRATLRVPNPKLWEPEEPNLYFLEAWIERAGEVVDRVHTYFGMRKISVATLPESSTPFICLNDQPIYILGALHQSFNPWGIYTYRSEEDIKRDIELAQAAGFNCLRVHIKVEEPLFYYWADRLGMLILYDLPNFANEGFGELACARWEKCLRAAIARDFNHPAIVAWVLFNESWGLGGKEFKTLPERQQWVRNMVALARKLDRTRLVEDNSPCHGDHVDTDINSWHFYINDYEQAKEHIAEVVAQCRPGSPHNFCPGAQQGGQPLLNSEYGGISARMGDRDVSWCLRFLTNELRRHEKICGYVYTELTDIEWERNGIYNYDRTPKYFPYDLQEVHSPDFIAFHAPPAQRAQPGEVVRIPVAACLFDREMREGAELVWWVEHTDCLGRTVAVASEGQAAISAPPLRVSQLGEIEAALPDLPGLSRLTAEVLDGEGVVLARNFIWFDIEGDEVELDEREELARISPEDIALEGFEQSAAGEFSFGAGAGVVRFSVSLPRGRELAKLRFIRLIAELASYDPSLAQTDEQTTPSDLTVRCNGVEIDTVPLPDCPVDARGVLSYLAGIPGRRGYRTEVTIYKEKLGQVLELREGDTLRFELEVKRDAENVGGVSIFFRNTGSLPLSPTILFGYRR